MGVIPVGMRGSGIKAFWAAMRAQRVEMAEYYQSKPDITVKEVMRKFRVSHNTVKKALDEAEVRVDRARASLSDVRWHREQWTCPCCHKVVRHLCRKEPTEEEHYNTMLAEMNKRV